MTQDENTSLTSVRDMEYLSEEKKVAFKAFILKRFGIMIDTGDEVFPLLYLTYHNVLENSIREKKTLEQLNHVQQLVRRQSVKQYQFPSAQAAFGYSFGKVGFPIIFALSLLFIGFLLYQFNQQAQYRSEHLQHWIDQASINQVTYDGMTVPSIQLTQTNSIQQAQAGKHYLVDSACQCIQIPLYFPQ
ncbi:MAG: hypothetical protein RIG62_17925 [Cyclobacteriaceae bacterium]